MPETDLLRRSFLKNLAVIGSIVAIPAEVANATPPAEKGGNGYTFLFQGDSVTNGNRTRNYDWNHVMGHGYQYIFASKLWYDFPAKGFHSFNRGVSGNKVTDLAARWQKDMLELNPGLISILIGINDTSASVNRNSECSPANYQKGYRSLLDQARQALPAIQFALCEPFMLQVGKVREKLGVVF